MEQPLQSKTSVVQLEADEPEDAEALDMCTAGNRAIKNKASKLCHARTAEIEKRQIIAKVDRNYNKQPFELTDKRILFWENKRSPVETLLLKPDGHTLQIEKPVHWKSADVFADLPIVLSEKEQTDLQSWYEMNLEEQRIKLEKALQPYSL